MNRKWQIDQILKTIDNSMEILNTAIDQLAQEVMTLEERLMEKEKKE